jgi:ankyrin repeat protein
MQFFNKLSPHEKQKKKELALQTNLLKSLKNRRFASARNMLLGASPDEAAQVLQLSGIHGGNFLHFLVQYQPTVGLVTIASRLLNELSELSADTIAEDTSDRQGRKPLHIAMEYGCDSRVTAFLLQSSAGALPALSKDTCAGRYPLHYACARPNGRSNSLTTTGSTSAKEMLSSIEQLLQCERMTALVADKSGQLPLDLARQHGASLEIIACLERATKCKYSDAADATIAASATSCISVPTVVSAVVCCDDDLSSIGGHHYQGGDACCLPAMQQHLDHETFGANEIPTSIEIF